MSDTPAEMLRTEIFAPALHRAANAEQAAATPRPSAATRYLAAATYTDRRFRDTAIALHEEPIRARAPEAAIDAGFVLAHCYAARRHTTWRDLALCLVPLWILASGVVSDLANYLPQAQEVVEYYASTLCGAWALATAIVFAHLFHTRHLILTQRFAACHFAAPQDPVAPTTPPGNVVVYGGFSPFVGAGLDLGGWSFTVNLEQARQDFEAATPAPFATAELYAALREGFERLGIDGLRIQDRLLVDGGAIRADRRLLPNELARPVDQVDPAVLEAFRNSLGKAARHYLALEISDWSGQLVLSTFIRLHKSTTKLFVETSSFILPPLRARYYALDKHSATQLVRKLLLWLAQAAVTSPFLALLAPLAVIAALLRPLQRLLLRRQRQREVRHDPMHNYGALQSIRELGMENAWRAYFQKLDKEMHSKIVQQQTLDVFVDFLDAHGVDTSALKDRGGHILNNGVIVSGGMINADSFAVGQGAQAKGTKTRHAGKS